jgi:hypothetical protein
VTRRFIFVVPDAHHSGLPAGEYLVTAYSDETCELARREQRHFVWGPPVQVSRTDHDRGDW